MFIKCCSNPRWVHGWPKDGPFIHGWARDRASVHGWAKDGPSIRASMGGLSIYPPVHPWREVQPLKTQSDIGQKVWQMAEDGLHVWELMVPYLKPKHEDKLLFGKRLKKKDFDRTFT